ncbi:chemotaxis protein CheW [Senegalia massiliensis]|uniref:Purine-binding chemotaxis protein CheW n=1 Tax=Senegalia massiliensis TaxID=1720316 RepID=A0A845QZY5_9CLOT|nr:chemotaxis protein CheW [Senegalia massiliensis]NBI07881.1 purine-binding chemotaxis protein CheW [Senegalia massiliensis]
MKEYNQYVIFKLQKENYAIDIALVKTIERVTHFTRVPNSEEYITGVINLRGEVIPIINLRKKFGLQDNLNIEESRIIITYSNDISVGLLVDSSSEVIDLDLNEIDNPPNLNNDDNYDYIKGIGKKNEELYLILDLDKILDLEREE